MSLLKIAKSVSWYKQGGAAVPFFIEVPGIAGNMNMHKKYGQSFGNLFIFFEDANCLWYVNKDSAEKMAYFFWDRHVSDPKYLTSLYNGWKRKFIRNTGLCTDLLAKDFSKADKRQLIKYYEKFLNTNLDSWVPAIFIDCFDPFGEKILMEEVKSGFGGKNPLSPAEVESMLATDKPTYYSILREELLKAAVQLRKSEIKNNLSEMPELEKKLKKISQRFFWVNNNYAGAKHLDEHYFFNELKHILKASKGPMKGLEAIYSERKKKSMLKKEIIRRHNIPKSLISHFRFFSFLTYWRDERKKFSQMSNAIYDKLIHELSRRSGIGAELLKSITLDEYKKVLLKSEKSLEPRLRKRMQNFAIYIDVAGNSHFFIENRKKVRAIMKKIIDSLQKHKGEIKGTSASLGLARGKVKIVLDERHFGKMKKGDVLVAQMTRPEYLPVMKLASAIITDEGGITSHAAIVSRELKIPCVIGTQTATTSLKDGTHVEVNANEGIVKVLKK